MLLQTSKSRYRVCSIKPSEEGYCFSHGCSLPSVLLNTTSTAPERRAAWHCSRLNRDFKTGESSRRVETVPVCEDCRLLDTFLRRGVRWHYNALIVKLKYPLNTFQGGFHRKYLGSLLPRRTCSRVSLVMWDQIQLYLHTIQQVNTWVQLSCLHTRESLHSIRAEKQDQLFCACTDR